MMRGTSGDESKGAMERRRLTIGSIGTGVVPPTQARRTCRGEYPSFGVKDLDVRGMNTKAIDPGCTVGSPGGSNIT